MHPYLTKLGIRKEVQLFFAPYYRSDGAGNLLFFYGAEAEHFGFAFHRVPRAVHVWHAGNENRCRQVLIGASAMEAICFLSVNFHRYPALEQLFFIALGTYPSADHFAVLRQLAGGKKIALVFGRDILGRLTDIYLAAGLTGRAVRLRYAGDERFQLTYQSHTYPFHESGLTLSGFEKAAGVRFGIRTHKAKGANSFLEQLFNAMKS